MHKLDRIGRARITVVAVVVLLAAAGAAWASIPDPGGAYTACRLNATGTIRLIDPSGPSASLLSHCTQLETQITWNQSGKAGMSPTVSQLAVGDANCPAGGAAITDARGSTAYVCSGAPGRSFQGTFTSPNGDYALSVTDDGVKLSGPAATVRLDGAGVFVSGRGVTIDGGDLSGLSAAAVNDGGVTINGGPRAASGANGAGSNGVGINGYGANGDGSNGVGINGYGANGYGSNGVGINGFGTNGYGTNGYGSNGVGINGYGTNGYGSNDVGISTDPTPGAHTPIMAFGALVPGSGCRPVARLDDTIALLTATDGTITSGSPTVCID